jgi:hypothetical protein
MWDIDNRLRGQVAFLNRGIETGFKTTSRYTPDNMNRIAITKTQ